MGIGWVGGSGEEEGIGVKERDLKVLSQGGE